MFQPVPEPCWINSVKCCYRVLRTPDDRHQDIGIAPTPASITLAPITHRPLRPKSQLSYGDVHRDLASNSWRSLARTRPGTTGSDLVIFSPLEIHAFNRVFLRQSTSGLYHLPKTGNIRRPNRPPSSITIYHHDVHNVTRPATSSLLHFPSRQEPRLVLTPRGEPMAAILQTPSPQTDYGKPPQITEVKQSCLASQCN